MKIQQRVFVFIDVFARTRLELPHEIGDGNFRRYPYEQMSMIEIAAVYSGVFESGFESGSGSSFGPDFSRHVGFRWRALG